MVNVARIKGLIREHGMTQADLAEALQMDASTLNRKLNKQSEAFTIREAKNIMGLFDLTLDEMTEIFFGSNVSKMRNKEVV